MTLALRTTETGLVLAEEALDETRLRDALKRIDDRLVLQRRDGMYVVVCVVSDNYAPVICGWHDDHGRALPLSSGLLDKVQRLRLDARNKPLSVDEHNARLQAQHEADYEASLQSLREEHQPYIERGRVQVTFADTGKPRYWRRDHAKPRSGGKR